MAAQEPGSGYRIDEVAPGAGHTVLPGAQVSLAVTAAPDAVCWVHPDGDDDPTHRLPVYAPARASASSTYPLALRFSRGLDEAVPPPVADIPSPAGARERPGLSP